MTRLSTIMQTRVPTLALLVVASAGWPVVALAQEKIFLDLAGIDGIPGLSNAQKLELKGRITSDVQSSFTLALGPGKVAVVTDDPTNAARFVSVQDVLGAGTRRDGSQEYFYGEWFNGTKYLGVYVQTFTVLDAPHYKKDDGSWDLVKLANGIGRNVAHEVAHSYSAGHNLWSDPQSIMTEGGLVGPGDRASKIWIFDDHSAKVMKNNLGKKPCATARDYDEFYLHPLLWDHPDYPYNVDETGNFDGFIEAAGTMAGMFDLGWYGQDTDNGQDDGNSEFDFVYKTSMEGTPGEDAEVLTFFAEAHSTVQFLLRGQEGTPFEGEWFPMDEADILLGDPIARPDGLDIYRWVQLGWDIDPEAEGFEVTITLDSTTYGAQYNGWKFVPEPASLTLLALGGLGTLKRRRIQRVSSS